MLVQLKQRTFVILEVFYARVLLHRNLMIIENLFSGKVGHQIYSSTISLNRFKFIKRMITSDDSIARNDRWKKDKFSALTEVLETFNNAHKIIHQTTFSA